MVLVLIQPNRCRALRLRQRRHPLTLSQQRVVPRYYRLTSPAIKQL